MKFRSDRIRIAVVGCGFRMPGCDGDGDSFWDALIAGKDLISTVDAARWPQDAFLNPRRNEPGTSYTFAAGSVGDISGFDAGFFGISPREAEQMDPQQRVLLEMAWEAFENGGVRPSAWRGLRCGVYVGLSSIDYAYRRADDLGSVDATTMTGNTGSIAANRLSYVFDLRGPSMVIDTACSSSLVALHQACHSIRHGESDAALVGGISLHLHPYAFIGFSKASMLSRQGRCSVFDERADGYVRSEGGAVLLLKPLPQAIADRNRILAVVVETGVNNDGRKSGLTVPSHVAQAQLLREIYERAGIAPSEIDYLEAHGTGTAVGDPIETRAIGEALGQRRPTTEPLPIGSVKSNVGHLEAAAGMAGLVKSLYVLRHRRVPANLHLEKPNPNIDFAGWNLAPVTSPLTLDPDRRLIVGVSAFGFGGTNAHAILSNFSAAPAPPAAPILLRPPLMLSARSPNALQESARRMALFLRAREDLTEYDIAYSAMFSRELHPYRLSASGADRAALALSLERFGDKGTAPGVITGRLRPAPSPPAFVFCGNGAQWAGMGVQLIEQEPVFRASFEEIDSLYLTLSGRSVLAELLAVPADSHLNYTEVAQPLLFAMQVALTRLLERRGIRPLAVCGHSVGEVAAAWASGALTLEAAARVVYERSTHQASARGRGCMATINLGEFAAVAVLDSLGFRDEIVIAAINSPSGVTVAGAVSAMTPLEDALLHRRIAFKRLPLDYAFHSAAMDPIRAALVRALSSLTPRASEIPLYSTVTGELIDGVDLGAEHWWRNVREPVRFQAVIQAMMRAGINTFIEIGPRPILTASLHEIVKGTEPAAFVLPVLTSSDCGSARIASVAEQLELCGALPDPTRLFPVSPLKFAALPHYAWQRERHWHPSTPESVGLLSRHSVHPLLGYAIADGVEWENHLDIVKLPVYADHAVGGCVVFPAAGFVEMALAAAAQRRAGGTAIEDFEILSPLLLERDRCKVLRFRIDADDGSFTIESREHPHASAWQRHVVGRFVEDTVPEGSRAPEQPPRAPDVSKAQHYARAQTMGLRYGPAFQSVTAVWLCEGAVIGSLELCGSVSGEAQAALLHPAYLDGALQLLFDLAWQERARTPDAEVGTFLPVRIDRLTLTHPRAHVATACATLNRASRYRSRALLADFTLWDASGKHVASAQGVRFRATSPQRATKAPARWITTSAVPVPRREGTQALPLISVEGALRICAGQLHSPGRIASRLRFTREVEPLLDALCAAFAERSLRELSSEGVIDCEQLLASGRIHAHSLPLLRGLLQMLCDDGVCQALDNRGRSRFAQSSDWQFPEPRDIWASLIGDYPEYAAAIARTGAAGLRLSERLRTPTGSNATDQQPRESSFAWVDASTQPDAAAVACALNEMLAAAAMSHPMSRPRVLQLVGAVPPQELAAALTPPDFERCDLRIGARTARELEEYRLRFPTLVHLPGCIVDLDSEVTETVEERFDLILVTASLTDAVNLGMRLRNIRGRLLEGGLLVLIEQHPSRATDLLYGFSPGWWGSGAAEIAGHPVCLRPRTPTEWIAALTHAGFAETQSVCDTPQSTTGPYFLMARATRHDDSPARASEEAANAAAARLPRTWLLLQDAHGSSRELGDALASELAQRGDHAVQVTAATEYGSNASKNYGLFALDPAAAQDWRRLLAELQDAGLKPDGWVHLGGLDRDSSAGALDMRIAAAQRRVATLIAWLQASDGCAPRPECWIVGTGSDRGLNPTEVLTNRQWQSDGLRDAPLWGLTRVAMHEFADTRVRWVDLSGLETASAAEKLTHEMLCPDDEDEVLLTAQGRFAPRFNFTSKIPVTVAGRADEPVHRFCLDFAAPGSFRNLEWRAAPIGAAESALQPSEVEIEVRAAGLNFRDVMYAMGVLPEEALEAGFCGPTLGMELSGVVLRVGAAAGFSVGDEVIAIAAASFANRVRTQAFAVAPKPPGWSFTAAATVPTAFFTAYYSLVELAHLQAGERVLIHGAAGAVGIAAIQIARHIGAEVFATAGTEEKRDFVRLLGAERVFDSRSLDFASEIMNATPGGGVDVVLNSLSGEAMRRNLRLLRPFGRMIELGKRDFYENSRLRLRPFRNNIAYFGFDADQLIAQRPQLASRVLRELMALFAQGRLRPLPHRSFCATEIAQAFRHMQASRHIGKVVVTFPRDFNPLGASSTPLLLRSDATYLVSGGLSGFGLQTACWLAKRGARHLALINRSGLMNDEARCALEQLAAAGVTVRPLACDVADRAALQAQLAQLASQMPPIRGVVHAAMVIDDALIRDIEQTQLQRVLAPKMAGGWWLHEATLSHDLDFFLLYSSATTLFGNPGQGAYVAANMALEALAAERQRRGLPVTCVSLGPISDAGYLARNEKAREVLLGRMGGRALTADAALAALEPLLSGSAPVAGMVDLDWTVLGRFLPRAGAPKFSQLRSRENPNLASTDGPQELARRLALLSEPELLAALSDIVREEIAQVLRMVPERIDTGTSLPDMGMDSLMAVELSMSLETRVGVQLAALSLSDGPTIERIAARLAQQLRPRIETPAENRGDQQTLADRVRLAAARHMSEVSEKDTAEVAAEIGSHTAPMPLTYRQRQ